MDEVLKRHLKEAQKQEESVDYTSFSEDFWRRPEIVDYYSKLPSDEYNEVLADSVGTTCSDGVIVIVGGATGRLGRRVAQIFEGVEVIEVDSSEDMCIRANQIAKEEDIASSFISINGSAEKLPIKEDAAEHIVAGGFCRYFELSQRVNFIQQMIEASSGGVTLAEGRVGEILKNTAEELDYETQINSRKVKALNMTVYFNLLSKFSENTMFKNKVKQRAAEEETTYWRLLQELAGQSKKELYELRIMA